MKGITGVMLVCVLRGESQQEIGKLFHQTQRMKRRLPKYAKTPFNSVNELGKSNAPVICQQPQTLNE